MSDIIYVLMHSEGVYDIDCLDPDQNTPLKSIRKLLRVNIYCSLHDAAIKRNLQYVRGINDIYDRMMC